MWFRWSKPKRSLAGLDLILEWSILQRTKMVCVQSLQWRTWQRIQDSLFFKPVCRIIRHKTAPQCAISSWCARRMLIIMDSESASCRNSSSRSRGSSFTYATLRLSASTWDMRVPGRSIRGLAKKRNRGPWLIRLPLKQNCAEARTAGVCMQLCFGCRIIQA